jgi:hypothetical protein
LLKKIQTITNEVETMMTQRFLPFKLEKTNDEITPRAGLALFGEFMLSLNLSNDIDRLLPKPGSAVGYFPSNFINPIILMLQGGGKTLEDLRQIRLDTALQKILGIEAVPSSDAAGDWLRRMAEKSRGLKGLERVSRLILRRTLNQEAAIEYTLDIDATQIIAEKREAKVTYKGEVGYMPIVGHLAENGLIIGENFRDGNEAPQAGNLEFIKYCVRQLPSGKRIAAFRSDSAGYQAAIVNYCEDEDILFAIGADLDAAVKNAIKAIPESDWKEYGGNGHIAETVHSMGETKKAFRLIIVRRPVQLALDGKVEETERYKAIATNRTGHPEADLAWYNQRGEASENRIKELKLGFGMERMPCGTTKANAVYFRIGALAYNLFHIFRDWALPGEWQKHQISTIRWRFFGVAGKVVNHAGSIFLKVSNWAFELFDDVRMGYKELVWT